MGSGHLHTAPRASPSWLSPAAPATPPWAGPPPVQASAGPRPHRLSPSDWGWGQGGSCQDPEARSLGPRHCHHPHHSRLRVHHCLSPAGSCLAALGSCPWCPDVHPHRCPGQAPNKGSKSTTSIPHLLLRSRGSAPQAAGVEARLGAGGFLPNRSGESRLNHPGNPVPRESEGTREGPSVSWPYLSSLVSQTSPTRSLSASV